MLFAVFNVPFPLVIGAPLMGHMNYLSLCCQGSGQCFEGHKLAGPVPRTQCSVGNG